MVAALNKENADTRRSKRAVGQVHSVATVAQKGFARREFALRDQPVKSVAVNEPQVSVVADDFGQHLTMAPLRNPLAGLSTNVRHEERPRTAVTQTQLINGRIPKRE